MSLPLRMFRLTRFHRAVDQLLLKPWIQVCLFAVVFLSAWLIVFGSTAHSAT